MVVIKKKLVIVGDHDCGKTCLLFVFSRGVFPESAYFGYGHGLQLFQKEADVEVDDKQVSLCLCLRPNIQIWYVSVKKKH